MAFNKCLSLSTVLHYNNNIITITTIKTISIIIIIAVIVITIKLILAEWEQIEYRMESTAAACFLSHTHKDAAQLLI